MYNLRIVISISERKSCPLYLGRECCIIPSLEQVRAGNTYPIC